MASIEHCVSRNRVLVLLGFTILCQANAITSGRCAGTEDAQSKAKMSSPKNSGAPLAESDGQLGSAVIRLFNRGVSVSAEQGNGKTASELVSAVEQVLRRTQREPRPEGAASNWPARDEILRSGLILEVRFRAPVRQDRLGFIPASVSRSFWLNYFLIPLTGSNVFATVGDRKRVAVFPYEVIRGSDGKIVPLDWSANNQSIVYSTVDLQRLRDVLRKFGVKVPPPETGDRKE